MAYSPLEQGRILNHKSLKRITLERNTTPAQIAIAWVLRQSGVITIPKSSSAQRINENIQALEIQLTIKELDALNHIFPPPSRSVPLAVL